MPRPRRQLVRRTLAAIAAIAVAGVVALVLPATRTTALIEPQAVEQPATVIVIDYGATASLALPRPDGSVVLYAYGDWDYYAQRKRSWWNAVVALSWPTPGTLGRMPLAGPMDTISLRRQLPYEHIRMHSITVDRRDAQRLCKRLDRLHAQGTQQRRIAWNGGMDFAAHPERYTYFHNSNHAVAQWLVELDCQIDGPAVYSRWEVKPPE